MTLRIYNTLTRQKEDFVPLNPPVVRMYSCGPTVYGAFHIGNARTFVTSDVIRRWLIKRGYAVTYAQNITDVDDKIIRRAQEEGSTPEQVALHWTAYFLDHLKALGNLPADHHPRATQHIGGMIGLIKSLEKKGHAYATPDGSVWFHLESFPAYGRLSRMPLEQMQQGERVDDDMQAMKKSPMDFCLWKGTKPGEPSWKSPWGEGRPGWHIECSCMAMKVLGTETLDIHTGGVDLRFPHHENEIAQSEAATGKTFARYWIHQGMLSIDGTKMGKSLNNFWMIHDALAAVDALTLRYFLISGRYRDELDFSEDAIAKCRSVVDRMVTARRESERLLRGYDSDDCLLLCVPELQELRTEFEEGMDDDFGTPRALAVIAKATTLVNTLVAAAERDAERLPELARAAALLAELRDVLGLGPKLEAVDTALDDATTAALAALATELGAPASGDGPALVAGLIAHRAAARGAKNFAMADAVRQRLAALGISLEDKPGETTWRRA